MKIKTYGCKVNSFDQSLLEKQLSPLQNLDGAAKDLLVLNTCAVTGEAAREAIRDARKFKRDHPNSYVVATGCAAQVETQLLKGSGAFDLVVGNSHKDQVRSLILENWKPQPASSDSLERVGQDTGSGKFVGDQIYLKSTLMPGGGVLTSRSRAFLRLQDGCNQFCSYCVIPFARGRSRSVPLAQILSDIHHIQEQGISEVVLSGIHLADYEDKDSEIESFESLLQKILKETQIPRIRISSLDPQQITPRFLELAKDSRICPHFHISIQSFSNVVLGGMRRWYKAADAARALQKLWSQLPSVYLAMDIIVGFPTESAIEYQVTLESLKKLPWSKIHVFPYSERPGTRALKFETSIDPSERKRRAKEIRELSQARELGQAQKTVGEVREVVWLRGKSSPEHFEGMADNYWSVKVPASQARYISLHKPQSVRLTSLLNENDSGLIFYGEVVENGARSV